MKVFVSTHETQGDRKNDFCFVPEGEIVISGSGCTNGTADDACGCSRAMFGVKSRKGTSTIRVAEVPDLTVATYTDILMESETRRPAGGHSLKTVAALARALAEQAASAEVGEVFEYRDGVFSKRIGSPRDAFEQRSRARRSGSSAGN